MINEKMEIKLKSNYGFYLIIKADNVNIEEDIETREYQKGEDGKANYSLAPNRDISTESIDMMTGVLEDMIYYRKKDYDSSELIKSLFLRLPQGAAEKLASYLHSEYQPEIT